MASTAITTTTPQRPTAFPGSGPIDEEDADRELQVLTDALWDSYYGLVWNPVRDYVSAAVVPSVSLTVRRVLLWSSGVVLGGGGIWWWTTESSLPTAALASSVSATLTGVRDRARQQYHHPYNNSSVWTTALVGTVGLSLYARHYYYVRRPSSSGSDDDNDDGNAGKQKKEN